MGTLMGHVLPGTFFAIFAVWWGFCVAVKYFHAHHSTKKSRKPTPYQSTTTFPCWCCPAGSLRRIPLESYVKLICISMGILGEAVTGLKHPYNDALKRKAWTFVEVNAQHITMFFSFGLASFIEILAHAKYPIPDGIEYLANILAFGVEAFLFHFHLHGRDDTDIHVHTLLVYNILFCVLAGIWEFNRPQQILATYARVAGTLMQGAWFYAAGFILFFPSEDPYWRWSPTHGHILIITVIFVWLALLVCIFLFLQTALVWFVLKRRYRGLHRYGPLHNDDDVDDQSADDDRYEHANNHPLKSLKPQNGHAMIDVANNDDEDADSDSQIEFEQRKQYSSKI